MLTRYLYLLVALLVPSSVSASDPVELSTFIALPRPAPTLEIPYGANSSQAIDVFLPDGPGPHPVAILIHGGCWKDIPGAGREQLRHTTSAKVQDVLSPAAVSTSDSERGG